MKKILSILSLLLITQVALGATAQVNSVIGIGGAPSVNTATGTVGSPVITSPESALGTEGEWFTISATVGAATTGNYYHFMIWGPNSGQYQVPNGKTLHCVGSNGWSDGAKAGYLIGSATATFTDDDPTVPTGAQYFGKVGVYTLFTGTSADTWSYFPGLMTFAQNTYPFAKFFGSGHIKVMTTCRLTTP